MRIGCVATAPPSPNGWHHFPLGEGQSFYPKGGLISSFSFEHAARYPISSTDGSAEPYLRYAGCMTAGCGQPYTEEGGCFVDCQCPTYVGPFQFGEMNDSLTCDLGGDNVWSAANVSVTLPSRPPAEGK